MKVRVSEQADCDLRESYKYSYRQFGELQAEKYYSDLWRCFQFLAEHPHMGRTRPEFDPPARSHHHQKHVIFYDVLDDCIFIIRVLHERMDSERHFRR